MTPTQMKRGVQSALTNLHNDAEIQFTFSIDGFYIRAGEI